MAAVGWIGLGRLGGPCAAALQHHGQHDVMGYDVTTPTSYSDLPAIKIAMAVADVVTHTDNIVYVAVQTPHSPEYGGEYQLRDDDVEPRDFEYRYLINAVRNIVREAGKQHKHITIVIVSTVLPGTVNRFIRPLLNYYTGVVYHPFFIAQGTVVADFINPEFVLLGADHEGDSQAVGDLYATMHDSPRVCMSVDSAELTKVAYNTFITMKIVFANTIMEMAEATGADVDDVTGALSLGTDRIVSPAYMRAGMGDGGGCHPRDNIAMSWLAQRAELSVDLMGFMTRAREMQTTWLASHAIHWMNLTGLTLTLLGKTYKPGVASTAGSPALLLANVLSDAGVHFTHMDHLVDEYPGPGYPIGSTARVFFIATAHPEYAQIVYPTGSIVIDPFGYIPSDENIVLVTPGRKGSKTTLL